MIKYHWLLAFLIPLFNVFPNNSLQKPTVVSVGVYVSQIYNVNLIEQTFSCEFYLWLEWRGEYSPKHYEFVNAMNIQKLVEIEETDSMGRQYISAKFRGTFQNSLNVSNYPRDKHILNIEIENYEWPKDSLSFIVDTANTGVSPSLSLGGWTVEMIGASVTQKYFQPAEDIFSHYTFSISIERLLAPFIIKIFIPLLLVVGMSMLTFYLPPDEIEAQMSIGVTSLLSIIAFHLVIGDQLPDVGYATSADKLMMGSYIFIFFALVESISVNIIYRKGNQHIAKRIDRICRWLFPTLYLLLLFIIAI